MENKHLYSIIRDFRDAHRKLENVRKGVVCFGSARIDKGQYYDLSVEVCKRLSQEGHSIITGGGPGIMEACNMGCKLGKNGKSIGFNIDISDQVDNDYLDLSVKFEYFFCRKNMFARYANAFIVLPGGFGTLDELFEVVTLIQTSKLKKRPIILVGSHYWKMLRIFIEEVLKEKGAISKEDLDLLLFTDNVDEIVRVINKFVDTKERFIRNKFI